MDRQDQSPNLEEALRIAQSPAGQQLLELLRKNSTAELRSALQKASDGDYDQARATINALLSSPDAKALLDQLGGSHE